MPYREDLDAALARADALEQEVAELRAKTAALEARGAHDEQALADLKRRNLLERAKLREQAEQARREAARAAREADLPRHQGTVVSPRRFVRRGSAGAETSAASTRARAVALNLACILAGILLIIAGVIADERAIAAVAFALIVLLIVAMLLWRE